LRRIIIICTAAAVLIGATAAYAAFSNSYGAAFAFHGGKTGPISFDQTYTAAGAGGNRAAPLIDIKSSIDGLKADGKDFPKCTIAMINSGIAQHLNDKVCPKGSLIGEGPVNSLLGPATDLSVAGSPCNPYLRVYNGGQSGGKVFQTYFFVVAPDKPGYSCVTLKTGASAPYLGTVTQQGGKMVTDVPLPPDVSTAAGNLTGVYGSLIKEHLLWKKIPKVVGGKTVSPAMSVACKGGKHHWSVRYTAVDNSGVPQTNTVSGDSHC
jgi:hypothetical protein